MDQHGPVTEDKGPVESAVEALVYAPLGFALEARRLLPTFVERGRAQVQMAKVIGQFAVQQGQAQATKHLGPLQDRAEALLTGVAAKAGPDTAPAPTSAPDAPAPASATAQAGPDAATLAIAGYDSLAASQVIPRLEGLEADELEAVRRYETAHRGRKTILGKIDQLQAG